MKSKESILFFTCADKKYEVFAILYPLFIFESNKNCFVEIGLEDLSSFFKKYDHLIKFYNEKYPNKLLYREINFYQKKFFKKQKICPNSVRFLNVPQTKADYVYIGDIDIFILEEILPLHLKNLKKNNLDFSNIIRKNLNQVTGLHFIKYDLMYNESYLKDLKKINFFSDGDEVILYKILKNKNLKFPPLNLQYRPQHGIHVSLFNRPPFSNLTTKDQKNSFPNWFDGINKEKNFAKIYLKKRYQGIIREFVKHIKINDVELRRIIQIVDAACYFKVFYAKEK